MSNQKYSPEDAFSLLRKLKNTAGTGYYARRILSQLGFLLNMLTEETGVIPHDVHSAIAGLLCQTLEDGTITKDAALACETALSAYTQQVKTYELICAGFRSVSDHRYSGKSLLPKQQ